MDGTLLTDDTGVGNSCLMQACDGTSGPEVNLVRYEGAQMSGLRGLLLN